MPRFYPGFQYKKGKLMSSQPGHAVRGSGIGIGAGIGAGLGLVVALLLGAQIALGLAFGAAVGVVGGLLLEEVAHSRGY